MHGYGDGQKHALTTGKPEGVIMALPTYQVLIGGQWQSNRGAEAIRFAVRFSEPTASFDGAQRWNIRSLAAPVWKYPGSAWDA
jgi:type 1 glutamine amidotransferase